MWQVLPATVRTSGAGLTRLHDRAVDGLGVVVLITNASVTCRPRRSLVRRGRPMPLVAPAISRTQISVCRVAYVRLGTHEEAQVGTAGLLPNFSHAPCQLPVHAWAKHARLSCSGNHEHPS
jgi:hypothetical protein